MSKKLMIIIVVLFTLLLILATIILIRSSQQTFSSGQYLIYNDYIDEWQLTDKKPLAVVEKDDQHNKNGFRNKSVLRGFFDRYDINTDTLYVKAAIPFSGENLYEVRAMKVGVQQTFYCTQATITDGKTGETKPTFLYRFPVYDGQTLYTYFEKPLSLEDFFAKAKTDTWLFIQLTSDYSETQDNYLYKLVAVGLCE